MIEGLDPDKLFPNGITLESGGAMTLRPGFTELELQQFIYLLFYPDKYCEEKQNAQNLNNSLS